MNQHGPMMMKRSFSEAGGTWRMAAAMVLSGTIGLAVVESGQPPLVVVLFRCLIGGVAMAVWLSLARQWRPLRGADGAALGLGGLALVGNWLCLFSAYQHVSISVATVVYHTQPFMLLGLAALSQRERLQRQRLPWLGLAFVGVALTAEVQRATVGTAAWLGVALACAAAFLYAVATLATKRLAHLPPAQIATVQMGVGLAVLLPLAAPAIAPLHATGATALLTLGLVHTALMYTLMYGAFQRLPTAAIAALSFIYPLVALLVDVLWFGVRLSLAQSIGVAAIVLALVADQWRLRRGRLHAAGPAAAHGTGR